MDWARSPPGWHMVMLSGAVQLPVAVTLLSKGDWQNVMLPAVILPCPCQVTFPNVVIFPSPGSGMIMLPVVFPKFPSGGPPGAFEFPAFWSVPVFEFCPLSGIIIPP
jgi:hypothetical protein